MADSTPSELCHLEAVPDALETGGRQKASVQSVVGRALSPLIAIAVIILIWQIIFLSGWQPEYVLPSPGQIWDALSNQAAQDISWQSTAQQLGPVDSPASSSCRRYGWAFAWCWDRSR